MDNILKYKLISESETVGVAASGGADSMALLFLLKKAGFNVTALHFEHGIRGDESLRDAAFVKEYCEKNSIPFILGHEDVPAYAEKKKISTETAARILRYEFFESCGMDKIATAHHADDQAETVLQHIVRGSGIKGLIGMLPSSGRIIRPMLSVSKDDILDYCRQNDIPFVCDSTNEDAKYTRNKMRLEIIPALKNINPKASEALLRLSRSAADAYALITEKAKEIPFEIKDGEVSCDAELLKKQNPAVANCVLYNMFCAAGQNVDIEAEHFKEILALERTGAKKHIKNGYFAKYSYGRLIISNKQSKMNIDAYCVGFSDKVVFPGGRLEVTAKEFSKNNRDKTCESFSHIPVGAVIRTRKEGDVFKPLGGKTKKLKDYFVDAKIPREERADIPLLAVGNTVIWVIGYAISDDYKVNDPKHHITIKYLTGEKI